MRQRPGSQESWGPRAHVAYSQHRHAGSTSSPLQSARLVGSVPFIHLSQFSDMTFLDLNRLVCAMTHVDPICSLLTLAAFFGMMDKSAALRPEVRHTIHI